ATSRAERVEVGAGRIHLREVEVAERVRLEDADDRAVRAHERALAHPRDHVPVDEIADLHPRVRAHRLDDVRPTGLDRVDARPVASLYVEALVKRLVAELV